MRSAQIFVNNIPAGILEEIEPFKKYRVQYFSEYTGPSISLTLPISEKPYEFEEFPAFFDGLLPEGVQLEALLKISKIDRKDLFSQLVTVGHDLVGNVTVRGI